MLSKGKDIYRTFPRPIQFPLCENKIYLNQIMLKAGVWVEILLKENGNGEVYC